MNFARNTSLQGVLDSIIRSYLLNELPAEGGSGNTHHNIAERDFELSQLALNLQSVQACSAPDPNPNTGTDINVNTNNNVQNHVISEFAGINQNPVESNIDREYIKALHKCFEKRGVFQELQTFLRHKLVSILQDELPNLHQHTEPEDEPNTIVFRLVEDFLRCHKLLYTLSVLASESYDVKQAHSSKAQYGKLSSKEAEDLLDEIGIKRDTRLSGQLLKCYFDKEKFSLLESMQYLGIWMDMPLGQIVESKRDRGDPPPNNKGKGVSIFLTPGKKGEAITDRIEENLQSKQSPKTERDIIETQSLYELERKLGKTKEFKMQEAIVKYKLEEEKIRNELESQYNLQLIEKEKEYFDKMQKTITDINAEIVAERQEWMEMKAKQDNELCELRKQVNNMFSTMTVSQRAMSQTVGGVSGVKSIPSVISKINVAADIVPNCSCKCNTVSQNDFPIPNSEDSDIVIFPRRNLASSVESVQQDRISFLQYRLEHQEEEIKSLQKQLLLSPHHGTAAILKSSQSKKRERSVSGIETKPHESPDDLDSFILESKRRVGKLDDAASRVDLMMQQLFMNTRRTPQYSEFSISSRIPLSARRKVVGFHSQSTPLVSPKTSGLLHQQVPEKHTTFISSIIKNLPSFQTDMYNIPIDESSPVIQVPSISGQGETKEIPKVDELSRPSTPGDRVFPVAYGVQSNSHQTKTKSESKSSPPQRMPDIDQNFPQPATIQPEQEESLFHMAISEKRKSDNDKEKNLGRKALRHGALSREKVSSDGETSEQSRNVSLSESLKHLHVNKTEDSYVLKESQARLPNAIIVKSKAQNQSMEVDSSEQESREKQDEEDALDHSVSEKSDALRFSPTQTSKRSPPFQQGYQRTNVEQVEIENDSSNGSLSISAPKSEADDNNEDFWKL